MSIAVCVRKNGVAVIATDSHERFGDLRVRGGGTKLIHVPVTGEWIAHTGEAVMLDCLMRYFGIDGSGTRGSGENLHNGPPLTTSTRVFEFGLAFRHYLKDECHLIDEKPSTDCAFAHMNNSLMILAPTGDCFVLGGDLSVTEIPDFWAIGSGREIALGALTLLYEAEDAPGFIAERAVEIVCRVTTTCEMPVVAQRVEYHEAAQAAT